MYDLVPQGRLGEQILCCSRSDSTLSLSLYDLCSQARLGERFYVVGGLNSCSDHQTVALESCSGCVLHIFCWETSDREIHICVFRKAKVTGPFRCNQPIKDASVLVNQKPYHPTCFSCSTCQKPIGKIDQKAHQQILQKPSLPSQKDLIESLLQMASSSRSRTGGSCASTTTSRRERSATTASFLSSTG